MGTESVDIKTLARLARIVIGEADEAAVAERTRGIIEMVSVLRDIDTGGVEPMAHPTEMVQVLRADEVSEGDHRAILEAGAPQMQDGLFVVPRFV